MSSSTTPMLSDSALRSDEIPDGYLSLDEKVLTYILHDSAPQQINLVDCVGASAESCTLVVSFMPIAGGGGWGCRKLRREFVVQRFLCHTRTQASKWAEALWRVVNGMAPDGAAPPRKRWLILINPVSGPGNAVRIFGQVRPVLAANRVALTELVTTHAGHASEIAAGINLDDVDGIVCVGGDGLLHELVNGLMVRPDASAAVAQLHLGVLPGGSANSLCTSLVKAAGEPIGPMSSAYLLCRGAPQPIDLLRVAQPSRPELYGFLSLEWAMASDLDLGSEHLRWMGDVRRGRARRPPLPPLPPPPLPPCRAPARCPSARSKASEPPAPSPRRLTPASLTPAASPPPRPLSLGPLVFKPPSLSQT